MLTVLHVEVARLYRSFGLVLILNFGFVLILEGQNSEYLADDLFSLWLEGGDFIS